MRKLLSGAVALTLTLTLGACSTLEEAFMAPAPTAVPRAESTGDATTTTPATTATTTMRMTTITADGVCRRRRAPVLSPLRGETN